MIYISIIGILLIIGRVAVSENYVPFGYFAFEKAYSNYKPPKVKKPPYIPTDIACPGINDLYDFSARDTLCGDLNKGYVPKNPMNQNINDQPYPFELIKNKTLYFLANALPYLKQEINSIPKVARFVSRSKYKSQGKKFNQIKRVQQQYKLRQKRDTNTNTNTNTNINTNNTKENPDVSPEVRQKICEGTNKLLCQVLQSFNDEGSLSKSILNTVAQAVGNAATLGNIASLVNQYSSATGTGTGTGSGLSISENSHNTNTNKSTISQVLSTLSGLNTPSSYNPIMSILDFISNYQSSASSKSPSRRKNPDDEPMPSPVTPCSSVDEYVTPVFARNYQGIWKYVVQIPNEGYFTQTIQKASCVKNKCDFIEGTCRESPRWVSLLVAEIFYPHIYFPMNQLKNNDQLQNIYKLANNLNLNQLNLNQNLPSIDDFYNFQQYLNKRVEEGYYPEILQIKRSGEIHPRRFKRNINENNIKSDKYDNPNTIAPNSDTDDCDGHDKIGCYVIRVYYDWFLVNGSCKCWKSSSSSGSINEAIKRIFIGK